jgi:hypothetical protein
MIRPIITALVLFATLSIESTQAQQTVTFKRFVPFKQIVADIDFYASSRQVIAPYEKPVAEAVAKLKTLFGMSIPKGAIYICSSLEQKDAIYEPMVLKAGYSWIISVNTPDVRIQETMARMKSQMGGAIPAEILDRIKNRPQEMLADAEKQMVTTVNQQIAYAVLQTLLDKEIKYRSSRLDDMGKSPLPDWLDIGIAAYVSGAPYNISYLQQHMDQTFPLEDLIAMSRPFVASSSGGSQGQGGRGGNDSGGMSRMGGGDGAGQGGFGGFGQGGMPQGGMPQGGFGGRGGGGNSGGNGAQRGGNQRERNLPKDEQDRMLFDGQASTLFAYMIEKLGVEKVKVLVKQAVEGKESREFFVQPDVFGSNFAKTEADWAEYAKALKAPQTQSQRQGFPGQF